MKKNLVVTSVAACAGLLAADFPSAEITNGQIRAKIYLPNVQTGYYRGTRFDWSGVVYSLQYKGHNFYGPWVQRMDPKVRDFVYEGADIVGGPCSSIAGPVDEFGQVGWEEAKPGGRFVKIGVGLLKKGDEDKYDNYRLYEIVDPGKRTIVTHRDSIAFTQEIADPTSGYGYLYRKVLRLVKGKPEMILEHSLKNTGTRPIRTTVYNHNFLVLDNQPPGAPLVITVPFQIQTGRPPNKELAEIRGTGRVPEDAGGPGRSDRTPARVQRQSGRQPDPYREQQGGRGHENRFGSAARSRKPLVDPQRGCHGTLCRDCDRARSGIPVDLHVQLLHFAGRLEVIVRCVHSASGAIIKNRNPVTPD